MAPERAAALVLLDGSLAEDGSAEPETPRSGRRGRLLVAALRSRPAVAAWRVCGPTILTLTAPARRSLARSIPGLRDEMASISVLETCLHELSAYSSCVRQLHALRTTSPLTPQLPTLVVAANGRLQRRTPTRWVRAVLRQAREIAAVQTCGRPSSSDPAISSCSTALSAWPTSSSRSDPADGGAPRRSGGLALCAGSIRRRARRRCRRRNPPRRDRP